MRRGLAKAVSKDLFRYSTHYKSFEEYHISLHRTDQTFTVYPGIMSKYTKLTFMFQNPVFAKPRIGFLYHIGVLKLVEN